MNNLSSYCGLVDARIRASDKDLPVYKPSFDIRIAVVFETQIRLCISGIGYAMHSISEPSKPEGKKAISLSPPTKVHRYSAEVPTPIVGGASMTKNTPE